jgi:copper chaperone CopZ
MMTYLGRGLLKGAMLLLLITSYSAQAENSIDFGDYVVHYNAFTADTLSPQIAKAYDITRSKSRGVVNIAVLKKVPGTTGQSVTAKVAASAVNLTGQLKSFDLREIREDGAIYYIGEFRVTNQETLDFKVRLQPKGSGKGLTARFRQQFFTN